MFIYIWLVILYLIATEYSDVEKKTFVIFM